MNAVRSRETRMVVSQIMGILAAMTAGVDMNGDFGEAGLGMEEGVAYLLDNAVAVTGGEVFVYGDMEIGL